MWWFAAACLALMVAFLIVPAGLPRDAVYQAVSCAALMAMVAGLRRNNPPQRWPWRLMILAQTLWVIGDALSTYLPDIAHDDRWPNISDAAYLAAYPLFAAGLFLLIVQRGLLRDLGGFLDSAVLQTGCTLLIWLLLAQPTYAADQYSNIAAAVGLAYPIGDILLAALVIGLVSTSMPRSPSFRLLLLAIVLLVAADTGSTLQGLWSSSGADRYDLLWLASYLCWGLAALHPSMRDLGAREQSTVTTFSRTRLVAMTVAVLVGPAALAVENAMGLTMHVTAIVIGTVATFGIVVARMRLVISQLAAAYGERTALQDELAHTASHDALTGLSNRADAMRAITAALQRAQRDGSTTALLFIDLDGFKGVNDTYGHAAGDLVLRAVAHRLTDIVRGGDLAARFGGDEFVVLLERLAGERDAVVVAERIIAAVSEPIVFTEQTTARIGASVGIAFARDHDVDAQRLLHEADTAVYRVKAFGGNRAEIFDDGMRADIERRLELEAAVTNAVRNDELVLHYQPVVALDRGEITGFEALVRWQRPGHGIVAPADFLPAIESLPVIDELDAWVLRTATRQAAAWNAEGRALTMAVNISSHHLRSAGVVEAVRAALDASGLAPDRLMLEVAETAFVDHQVAAQQIAKLHDLGVSISIDDFGTGYNWVTRLRLPHADVIKTDRSFLGAQQGGRALLEYTVQVAHAFGIPVVVEGVERAEQLEWVRSLGCESAQGYLLGTPVPADEVEHLLVEGTGLTRSA
ncbi:MAG: putative bifunctional diguanylate cyclase/phosphodiesterase [Jatrophihabitans sp.]|uniref:putative bifunctional diguanylate cyclase/phosphodiesterase n=1 Tax=Jatrophihabitans sp. TaxID=1932789 RepID=UPI003F7E11FF